MAVRGSSGHGDTMSTVMRTGDQGGSRGVVMAWSRGVRGCMCIPRPEMALAYALQVWCAMADGEVRRQRETGRGGSPWVLWKRG